MPEHVLASHVHEFVMGAQCWVCRHCGYRIAIDQVAHHLNQWATLSSPSGQGLLFGSAARWQSTWKESNTCEQLAAKCQQLQARITALEQQLATEREWIAEATMQLRSFTLQSKLLEERSPMNDWPTPSPEDVCGVLDLHGMSPEEARDSLYWRHPLPRISGGLEVGDE